MVSKRNQPALVSRRMVCLTLGRELTVCTQRAGQRTILDMLATYTPQYQHQLGPAPDLLGDHVSILMVMLVKAVRHQELCRASTMTVLNSGGRATCLFA